jgi:hypothetical protein
MVTAIVVPIVILYFYWVTKKEMKEQDLKWLACANVPQESVLFGQIKSLSSEKQRFYYHRYIYVQEMKLQTDAKQITIKISVPLTKDARIDSFTVGETIRVYGSWEGSHFIFSHFVRLPQAET